MCGVVAFDRAVLFERAQRIETEVEASGKEGPVLGFRGAATRSGSHRRPRG
jgi:hypothetical protein